MSFASDQREWLETDGLGGFASGTVSGIRTRRYHALLLPATTPPTGRMVLVNGFEAWLETPTGSTPLSSHRYAPDVIHPDGAQRIASFQEDPWPQWIFQLADGIRVIHDVFVVHGAPLVALSWRLATPRSAVTLHLRPLLSGRDYHTLHHENANFRFEATVNHQRVAWTPYHGVPGVVAHTNGIYTHEPTWYRQFLYSEEQARGLDALEDLASPGIFHWNLSKEEAVLVLTVEDRRLFSVRVSARDCLARLRQAERHRRGRFSTRLERSAGAYLVKRGQGTTIIAGYPWFTDWGRDAFIALRGLCLSTGRLEEAKQILLEWAGTVSQGMLPNRFPDAGESPELNAVDASLWYIIAVGEFLSTCDAAGKRVSRSSLTLLRRAIDAILAGYATGTRYHIHLDEDGLLAAGEPGVALTWMDAKIGDWVVTPRIGKPVEVQALWLNALWIGSRFSSQWERLLIRGRTTFALRFWNEATGSLYDVVDVDHRPGFVDASCRPNQIFAVGGLPLVLLSPERARRVVDAVEQRLWTSMGLRSLAPGEPGYEPRYVGGVRERDAAYHQGTVWPWLLGPFVEAWVRVRGSTPEAIETARSKFLEPLLSHLDEAGLGHLPEIADAESPHTPRGCPFQAWSLGEALRLDRMVLSHDDGGGHDQPRDQLFSA